MMLRDDKGITTIEWLGMAAIAVLVIAFLLPEVRTTAGSLWSSIANEISGFFA
jgi:Flp pilus assembly pilin Flp